MYRVEYKGFLQKIERYFETKAAAELWLRQVGKFRVAKITEYREEKPCITIKW